MKTLDLFSKDNGSDWRLNRSRENRTGNPAIWLARPHYGATFVCGRKSPKKKKTTKMKVEAATGSLTFKTQHQAQPIPLRPLQKKQLGAICWGGYRCVKPPSATSTQTGLKGFRGLQEACGSLPNMCCAKRAKSPDDGAEDFSTGGSSARQEGGCSENIRRR